MNQINSTINFFLEVTKFQTKLSRRLDSGLNGISLNEFIIMHHLSQNPEGRMRRIDLADKIGLTASGITRLLLPMEKIGLVSREADVSDARVSYVVLARGGKTKLSEGLERLEIFGEDLVPKAALKKLEETTKLINELSKNI
ncbi:MAG: MarR family winged helix-turn-helix transcriptional regulator [Candidatus Falkowbacteria bacterium]